MPITSEVPETNLECCLTFVRLSCCTATRKITAGIATNVRRTTNINDITIFLCFAGVFRGSRLVCGESHFLHFRNSRFATGIPLRLINPKCAGHHEVALPGNARDGAQLHASLCLLAILEPACAVCEFTLGIPFGALVYKEICNEEKKT